MARQNRKRALFCLLDEKIVTNQYTSEDENLVLVVSIQEIYECLQVPSSYRYVDVKHKIISPLLEKISNESELTIKLVDEIRNERKITGLLLMIHSFNRPISKILDDISVFVRS